jgi:hypothetical protein
MVETQSIRHDQARLRWPAVERVLGAGPFAVVLKCGDRPVVRLFEDAIFAQASFDACCGNGCQKLHQLENLDERPAPRYVKKAHWFRDLDRD